MKVFLHISFIISFTISYGQTFMVDDFENSSDWYMVDADGDGRNWTISYPIAPTDIWNTTNRVAISYSFDLQIGPLHPDNIMVSPEINLLNYVGDAKLNWRAGTTESTEGDNYEEYYSVYVISNTIEDLIDVTYLNTLEPKFEGTLSEGNKQIFNTVDITEFGGNQFVRVIFRHHNCSDELNLLVDAVTISNSNETILNLLESDTQEIKIYPTIFDQEIFIESKKVKEFEIVNLNGQIVNKNKFVANQNSINLQFLSDGMYYLKIITFENKVLYKQIIKQKQ